jgi:hypothetical protein
LEQVAKLIDHTYDQLASLQQAVGVMRRAMQSSSLPQKAVAQAVREVAELSGSLT